MNATAPPPSGVAAETAAALDALLPLYPVGAGSRLYTIRNHAGTAYYMFRYGDDPGQVSPRDAGTLDSPSDQVWIEGWVRTECERRGWAWTAARTERALGQDPHVRFVIHAGYGEGLYGRHPTSLAVAALRALRAALNA